eukprot:4341209-Amphidinium_carterae.1
MATSRICAAWFCLQLCNVIMQTSSHYIYRHRNTIAAAGLGSRLLRESSFTPRQPSACSSLARRRVYHL